MDGDFEAYLKRTIEAPLAVYENQLKKASAELRRVFLGKLIDDLKRVNKTGVNSEIEALPDKINILLRKQNVDMSVANGDNETIIHVLCDGTYVDNLHYSLETSPRVWIQHELATTVPAKRLLIRQIFWKRNSEGKNCYEIALSTNNADVAALIMEWESELAGEINPRTQKLPLSLCVKGNKDPSMVKQLMDEYPQALLDVTYEGFPLYVTVAAEYTGATLEERKNVINYMTKKLVCLGDEIDIMKLP